MRGRLGVLALVALLALAGCEWPVVGYGPGRSGSSAIETAITPANAAQLEPEWTAHLVGAGRDPVVAGDHLYVTADGPFGSAPPSSALSAFAVDGGASCSGSPKVCTPSWSKVFDASQYNDSLLSAPAVADGRVFVGDISHTSGLISGRINAFDTTGAPRYTKGQGAYGSAAPAGGLLYSSWQVICCSGSGQFQGIQVQDAQTGDIRFGAALDFPTPPAVSGGSFYAGSGSTLNVFDAAGSTNCSIPAQTGPFPVLCTPLWTGSLSGAVNTVASPAVANGKVYQSATDGQLNVFSAGGCGASQCAPLWKGVAGAALNASPAVTKTTAFVASGSKLSAFDASGCGAAVCQPVWTATVSGRVRGAPSVAGDVVYIGSDDDHVYAFDARGCGHGTCSPLWSGATGAAVTTAPAISNGRVFVTDTAGTLHVYRLPPA